MARGKAQSMVMNPGEILVAVTCETCDAITPARRPVRRFCDDCLYERIKQRNKRLYPKRREYFRQKNREFRERYPNYSIDYYYLNRDRLLLIYRKYWISRQSPKYCPDCGITIPNKRGRCVGCAEIRRGELGRKQAKRFRKSYKHLVNDRNMTQLGTVSMKTKSHLITKEDGTPDFEAEAEEVKYLKKKTLSRRKVTPHITKSDKVRMTRNEIEKIKT